MALIVQKFGGTSVANLDRIRDVARRVAKTHEEGNDVVVILSAMAGVTDQLIEMANQISRRPPKRELDVLLATGEQTSAALLAMTLHAMGLSAHSLLGFQAEVRTDCAFGNARILGVGAERLRALLDGRNIVVVAGFQGCDKQGNITTLGRGGSDTSAVVIAAALNADVCEIYTDVGGVYTTDPRIVPRARKLERITYEEMLELASLGAKVLQTRSVALAMQYNVPVQVLSSFEDKPGTLVTADDPTMEHQTVSGITYSRDEAKITLVGVEDRPGVAARIFGTLADANVNVDMIVQSVSPDGRSTDVTFTVAATDLARAQDLLAPVMRELGCRDVVADGGVVKISVIGVGMRSHAGIAHRMFQVLAERGINIQAISTSEIKISVLIPEEYTELAIRTLHAAYGLDADA
ncbi:MAG: aspartate kinase [Thermodesulfobacteriota bacterium]